AGRHRLPHRGMGREPPDAAALRRARHRRRDRRRRKRDTARTRGPAGVLEAGRVTEALVAIRGVSHRFGADGAAVPALDSIDLEIPDGQFTAVVGPSGCGKSTLLSLVAGLRQPSRGTVRCDGELMTAPMPRKVGVIFQEANLLPWLTAIDNVAFPLKRGGVPRAERGAAAARMLALTGLAGFEDKLPHQLSGGMKQRVSIARGLVQDPAVLLMDEPFASLDEQTRMLLGDELLRI